MANEALELLQRTLIQILRGDHDMTTRRVKLQIICIHDKAVVLQLNLQHFREEETAFIFMEVANTAAQIIHHLFSPENMSDCGLTEAPAVRLLEQLASEMESTAGDVVDCISSSTTETDGDRRLQFPMELAARISNRFRRLFDKIKSTVLYEDLRSTELGVVSSSSTPAPTTKGVVRFEQDTERTILEELLLSFLTDLHVVSIVGMAGIGKSTLAKIVYDDVLIKQRFDVHAWITVSQDSTVESVLSYLLASLKLKTKQFPKNPVMEMKIYQLLYSRRYLVVLDDVRSTQLWEDIRQVFPDNANGSRILFTTRLMDVANHCWGSIHVMRFLDEQKSWDLFQREAFADQTCPLELQPVAKKIVKGCGGLPLSIVTKARHLSMFDKTPKIWQQIEANDSQLATISSSSYIDLRQRLRRCFWYMAAFPGDYEIHASEITKLWIAEGFMECSDETKSLEQVAEAYLEDLVEKNLVLVTSKKIDGSI